MLQRSAIGIGTGNGIDGSELRAVEDLENESEGGCPYATTSKTKYYATSTMSRLERAKWSARLPTSKRGVMPDIEAEFWLGSNSLTSCGGARKRMAGLTPLTRVARSIGRTFHKACSQGNPGHRILAIDAVRRLSDRKSPIALVAVQWRTIGISSAARKVAGFQKDFLPATFKPIVGRSAILSG